MPGDGFITAARAAPVWCAVRAALCAMGSVGRGATEPLWTYNIGAMKISFLGTRGYIEARSAFHAMHSVLLVEHRKARVLIDWGEDWLDRKPTADAVFVTHAHPDHSWGLKNGAPCPVYATEEAWEAMEDFDIKERRIIEPGKPVRAGGMSLEAFAVDHSTRAPAVGYRVIARGAAIFYVPDVVYIRERSQALSGIKLYVGDASTLARTMVRKTGGALIGHTPVRTQLGWCMKEGVARAVFTHCGSEVVEGDEKIIKEKVRALGEERGVEASLAHDGMELVIS